MYKLDYYIYIYIYHVYYIYYVYYIYIYIYAFPASCSPPSGCCTAPKRGRQTDSDNETNN